MKHPAAPPLATKFARLRHTNDRGETGYIPLPGFLTAGMAPEQANETGLLGQAIAEAIIETLDVDLGYVVHAHGECESTTQAEDDDEDRGVMVHCNRCRADLFELRLVSEFVKASPKQLMDKLVAHEAECR